MRMKKRGMIVCVSIAALLCFAGVVFATQSFGIAKTDWEWAQEAGLISANTKPEQTITQAQFLQMIMNEYHAEEKGIVVPAGAENHWAAEYYATAKKEGIIGCSCQIKPDGAVSVEEAAKFVAAAVNRKVGRGLLNNEEVIGWVVGERNTIGYLTYLDASTFIRNMDVIIKENSP